jgi:formylglycine-generating enzyme required for sulfatase activity
MGETEVTQESYRRVMGKNPSRFKGPKLPVEQVTWNDARRYCRTVDMRLPTEAEWEYAARAGGTGSRYGDVDAIAWHHGNSQRKTHEVGGKQPNPWGLYDMLGSVVELVADWFGPYSKGSTTDPQGPPTGSGESCAAGIGPAMPGSRARRIGAGSNR